MSLFDLTVLYAGLVGILVGTLGLMAVAARVARGGKP